MLLLWSDDKGLEIYITETWAYDGDDLLLLPVWKKLEACVRSRSNRIQARFQLRSIKQGEMKLEEFITRARTLIGDSGYPAANREEILRDTLVFGIKSDKVRRDAIAIGNDLIYQQVYDLAKTEIDIIAGNDSSPQVHDVRSKRCPQATEASIKRKMKMGRSHFMLKRRKLHINRATSVKMNTQKATVQSNMQRATFARILAITRKFAAKKLRKVNEMTPDDSLDELNAYNLVEIGTITTMKSVNNVSAGQAQR